MPRRPLSESNVQILEDLKTQIRNSVGNSSSPTLRLSATYRQIARYYLSYQNFLRTHPDDTNAINPGEVIDYLREDYINALLNSGKDLTSLEIYEKLFLRNPAMGLYRSDWGVRLNLDGIKTNEINVQYLETKTPGQKDIWDVFLDSQKNKFFERFNPGIVKGDYAGQSIAQLKESNKGGFWENLFGSTSPEYQAFRGLLDDINNTNSIHYGDLGALESAALAYIEHKIKGPVTDQAIRRLGRTGRNRVSFCQAVLQTIEKTRNKEHTLAEQLKGVNEDAEEYSKERELEKDFFKNAPEIEESKEKQKEISEENDSMIAELGDSKIEDISKDQIDINFDVNELQDALEIDVDIDDDVHEMDDASFSLEEEHLDEKEININK